MINILFSSLFLLGSCILGSCNYFKTAEDSVQGEEQIIEKFAEGHVEATPSNPKAGICPMRLNWFPDPF